MRLRWLLMFVMVAALGCSASDSTGSSGTEEDAGTAGGDAGTGDAETGDAGTDDAGSGDVDEPDAEEPDVPDTPPEATPPEPASYSMGACPTLEAGANAFSSFDTPRDVTVTLPSQPEGAGVLFLWHGFGDSGPGFSTAIGAASVSEAHNVITVSAQAIVDPLETEKLKPFAGVAAAMGPMPPTWSIIDGPELDMTLFDDLLACVDEQYGIDRTRVYTMGFSQGALWSTLLVLERSNTLAAALLWSGGLGWSGGLVEVVRFDYATPERPIPVLAASGGATDLWPNAQLTLVNFTEGTKDLVEALRADGHAAAHCDHGLGHTVPVGGMGWGLDFMFAHSWSEDGASDYFGHDGAGFPEYCTFPAAAEPGAE